MLRTRLLGIIAIIFISSLMGCKQTGAHHSECSTCGSSPVPAAAPCTNCAPQH